MGRDGSERVATGRGVGRNGSERFAEWVGVGRNRGERVAVTSCFSKFDKI